jgi:hypothetical protein
MDTLHECMHFFLHLKHNSLNISQSKECFQQHAVENTETDLCIIEGFHSFCFLQITEQKGMHDLYAPVLFPLLKVRKFFHIQVYMTVSLFYTMLLC